MQLLRLLQPALRTAGQHTLAAAGGTAPPPLLTAADHDKLRRDCQTGVELVKAVHEVPESRRMFMVSWGLRCRLQLSCCPSRPSSHQM